MSSHQYARSFDEFVGQELAKQQLVASITAAKMMGVPLGHVLLASGEPGIGKSNLAHIIANMMGGKLKEISGAVPANKVRMILADMADGDVLFYDEIHLAVKGGKANAEWLLNLLWDGMMPGPRQLEPAPKITVIGATTDAGKLPETIIDRFTIQPKLVSYNDVNGARIALALTAKTFPQNMPVPDTESCKRVARASNNNPRRMISAWERVRDIYLSTGGANYDGDYDITLALQWLGLTDDGLDSKAQRYLICMYQQFGGQPVGKTAIQDAMQEPGGLHYTERVLQAKGFIELTKGGRMITTTGIKRAKELIEPEVAVA